MNTIIDILIVEDNMDDFELMTRALKKNNITNRIFHVDDGEKALDFIYSRGAYSSNINNTMPKIIFLDLKLPKVDGLEVVKQLKSDPKTSMIPIPILTSSKEEGDIVKSYQLGVNSYIVKPVDFTEFMNVITQLGLYWVILNEEPKF